MDAPSDLIVDVARAADPARAANVARRLEALASSDGAGSADFAGALSAAGAEAAPSAFAGSGVASSSRANIAPATALPAIPNRADKVREKFEATLLNSFVSEMMPKDASSVYGEGYAGDMWKSLLSEKISDQIAKSGSLGLTRSLFSGGQASALEKLKTDSRANSAQPDATLMSANALSLPVGGQASEGAYLFTHGKTL